MRDDEDADCEYMEELCREREAKRSRRCQCGPDLPGACPGPSNCPNVGRDDEEDDKDA